MYNKLEELNGKCSFPFQNIITIPELVFSDSAKHEKSQVGLDDALGQSRT
jgi:hypothetical protein